jgi:hypothetical protein
MGWPAWRHPETVSKMQARHSLTAPQAAWVARKSVDPSFAYDANYLIDNKAGIIATHSPRKRTALGTT